MLEFECPHCKTVLQIPEQFAGSTGTCRKCRNSITIDIKPAAGAGNGHDTPFPSRRPTLIVFHLEVTGPASRKDTIIELGAIKIDGFGNQVDTFWSLANPDEPIPEKIIERTSITNDMVAASPFAFEVVKDWFDWAGPNAIFLCDHARFHSKFICATLLREDIIPPVGRAIDVVHWAEDLAIPATEYKLRPLLDAIGYSGPSSHRAMDACQGLRALVQRLLELEQGRLPKQEEANLIGKLFGKKAAPEVDPRIYKKLNSVAATLDDMCGKGFYAREKYDERQKLRAHGDNGSDTLASSPLIHMPEWYQEKKRHLASSHQDAPPENQERTDLGPDDALWTEVLMAATESHDAEEQRKLLMKAVSLGARDPWPYERLTGFYIRAHDYESAQRICQKYFEGDIWDSPRFSESSIRLLDRMEKLERRLAGVA